jgi:hypothetical protein
MASDKEILEITPYQELDDYINLLQDPTYFFEPLQSPFIGAEKGKCVTMDGSPDLIVLYNYNQKNEDRIYDNSIPVEVYRQNYPTYFTFIIDKKGIRFGHVKDALELGVPHMMLTRSEEDEVYISGEVMIRGNELYYNFVSGTFAQRYKLKYYPNAHDNYIMIVRYILKKIFPTLTVNYTKYSLFPTNRPLAEDTDAFCKEHPTQIFFDPLVPKCMDEPDFDRAIHPANNVCTRRARHLEEIRSKMNQPSFSGFLTYDDEEEDYNREMVVSYYFDDDGEVYYIEEDPYEGDIYPWDEYYGDEQEDW